MTLEHIGIAVESEDQIRRFESLLQATPYKSETVAREGVQTLFFGDGGVDGNAPKLELLDATSESSPIATYLAKRGPGIHHLAFEVQDLKAEIRRMRALGIRPLADAPKPGADGKEIVFLHPKDTAGVLVELVQSVRQPVAWTTVDGPSGPLAVQVSGPEDAPPLLVLHGALGSTEMETDRLIRRWERSFRVLAPDMRGHGKSISISTGGVGWTDYTDDAITVLNTFASGPVAVFGFSMGAGVALALASRHPERVSRMATLGANVRWSEPEVRAMTEPMQPDVLASDTQFWASRLAEVHGDRWRQLVADVIRFTEALPSQPMPTEALAAIRCPTLIAHGDSDRFFDVSHAVELYREIPDASLWVLPGLDHPIQGVDPVSFADRIGSFLLDP